MESIDAKTKFCAAFAITNEYLEKRLKSEDFFISKFGERYSNYKKMMYKNDMEEYSVFFLSLFYREAKPELYYKISDKLENILKSEMELLETLGFARNNNINEIILNTPTESHKIKNKNVIDAFVFGGAFYYFSQEDKLNRIKKGYENMIDNLLTEDQEKENFDHINEFLITPDEDFEEKYYNRNGAPKKNELAYTIGKQISYLIRIERFLSSSKEITDIEKIQLKNKDFRFIHDCLSIIGEIKNQSNRENTTTTPEKYIRSLLKQTIPYNIVIHKEQINNLKQGIF